MSQVIQLIQPSLKWRSITVINYII